MKKLTYENIQAIETARNSIILENISQIKEVEKIIPYNISKTIRHEYATFLKGYSLAAGISWEELENILDIYWIGSHDTAYMLAYYSALDIYHIVKGGVIV